VAVGGSTVTGDVAVNLRTPGFGVLQFLFGNFSVGDVFVDQDHLDQCAGVVAHVHRGNDRIEVATREREDAATHGRERLLADQAFRKLGLAVAINLIVDPQWEVERFRQVREWALAVPEIVHLSVMTPYPGTEIWHTEARALTSLDYRLFEHPARRVADQAAAGGVLP